MNTSVNGLVAVALLVSGSSASSAPAPEVIAAPGETVVVSLAAVGAQIYRCQAGADGKLGWKFREPIAALLADGKTVGRHYAGPAWELVDGSAVSAKTAATAPGATPRDIALLKLDVVEQRGAGLLAGVTTVQRLDTRGGVAPGACEEAGAYLSVPYSAVYRFLSKGG